MAEPVRPETAPSRFGGRAKIDDETLIRLAYAFCQGLGIRTAAASAGVSAKTAREYYLRFRSRLIKPRFNKWHGLHRTLPTVGPEEELLLRSGFLTVLAACYGNTSCYRNFTAGNRKARLCRSCPVPAAFSGKAAVAEALDLIDSVRRFYAVQHIRGEKGEDPAALFMKRLVHTVTIATAKANSKRTANGLFDPLDTAPLSVGTLLDALLSDLAESPSSHR